MSTLSTRNAEYRYPDRRALAEALAERVARDLADAVTRRGRASLVVSGGSTPGPFFESLGRRPLAWRQIQVTLADERWVPVDDAASNEGFVRRTLLSGPAAEASLIGLKNDHPSAAAGRDICELALEALYRPFDVVVLGMGDDGHTASLFPGAAELAAGIDPESDRSCVAIRPPEAPHSRMSLTASALLDSRRLILHITGESKWRIYHRAMGPGPVEDLPVRSVLRGRQCEVWWAP